MSVEGFRTAKSDIEYLGDLEASIHRHNYKVASNTDRLKRLAVEIGEQERPDLKGLQMAVPASSIVRLINPSILIPISSDTGPIIPEPPTLFPHRNRHPPAPCLGCHLALSRSRPQIDRHNFSSLKIGTRSI